MNKDQINGAVIEAAGKVQAQVGKVVGNTAQQVKGHIREAEGKAQHLVGNAKTLATDATHNL
ncbi:CsbD family protein [Rhodoferax sp. PAMC 29310]|uniref:CsbD family protein n=1 Tax=Rhodoferax sp. PAMC 29310 TaxID=2822760 RepID=UPI001B3429BE|nr:CsbD family protein [Rhodoferax sp. PAMC 29310]